MWIYVNGTWQQLVKPGTTTIDRKVWYSNDLFSDRNGYSFNGKAFLTTTTAGDTDAILRFNFVGMGLPSGDQNMKVATLRSELRPTVNLPIYGYNGNDGACIASVATNGDIFVRWSSSASSSGWVKSFNGGYAI